MNNVKFLLVFLLVASRGSAQAQEDLYKKQFLSESQVIVELVYPMQNWIYSDQQKVKLLAVEGSAVYNTAENALASHFSAMRNGDVGWFLRTWDLNGIKIIEKQFHDQSLSHFEIGKRWKDQFRDDGQIFLRRTVTFGNYALIKYDLVRADKIVFSDSVALRKYSESWKLTQELASDPILTGWEKAGRIRMIAPVVLDSFVNKK